MKLHIERPYVEAMLNAFPTLSPLKEQLRFGNRVEVAFNQLKANELAFLQNLYQQAGPGMNGRAAQIATLRKAINDDAQRFSADDLEKALPAIAEYLIHDIKRGWLFRANAAAKPIAYVITRLDYTPPGEEEAGRILLELKANSRGKIATETLTFRSRDIDGCTVSEIFANKGYLKETDELINAYDESSERYFAWRAMYGHQFSGKGTGIVADDPSATHRNTDWSRKNIVVLSTTDSPARILRFSSPVIMPG